MKRHIVLSWTAAVLLGASLGCTGRAWSQAPSAPPSSSLVAPTSDGLFLGGFFPIGVFSQPVQSFTKWKSRGINTLLEVPQNHDPGEWDAAARQAGFRIIRRPLSNPRSDIGRKDLLAWSHWDEPDAAGRIFEWTPAFEKTFADWRRIDPQRKVFINFAGPDITWFTAGRDDYSRRYASHYPRLIASSDWVAADIYPNGGWLNQGHQSLRGDVALIAEPMRVLKRLTDKPQFAFIEASEIEQGNVPGARCPTPEQMRAQIWIAVVEGARGLFYFPAVVGTRGFQFDGAPPGIVAEMTKQNQLLAKFGPLLQGPINPSGFKAEAPQPLFVGWRKGKDGHLVIVVNPTPRALSGQRVSLLGAAPVAKATILGEGVQGSLEGQSLSISLPPYGAALAVIGAKP